MDITRRRLLQGAAALGLGAAASGCGFVHQPSDEGDADTLTFTTWGTDAELAGFRSAISAFEREFSGRRVQLNAVPYEQMFTNIDAQLQAGNAPDIFRVPYYAFGAYAGRGQLLDLSRSLNAGVGERFTDPAWEAVQSEGRPFGVPHHTDTSAILVNTALAAQAGITDFPESADEAWTWDEFAGIAQRLRTALPAHQYPFAYNWQGNGVTRWLSLLFQANGRFLTEDGSSAAIDSDAGREALEFSQRFFAGGWVPANNSVKSSTYASDTWFSGTTAMVFSGAFQIPDAQSTVTGDWTATFAPRDVRGGSDFGGNALVATAQTPRPELAASFLDFVTRREHMERFCAGASLLPTRTDLLDGDFRFDIRPELSPVFLGQASLVQPRDVAQIASPNMAQIITVLKDGLDEAFAGSAGVEQTIDYLSSGINDAVARAA